MVEQSSFLLIALLWLKFGRCQRSKLALWKPGLSQLQLQQDQFWVKTKRLAWRMTAQPYNRELKQTDAAAERRRSTRKFLFRRTQGQVNSVGPWLHSLLNWMEIWMWPPPLGRRVSLLELPNHFLFVSWSWHLWCNGTRLCNSHINRRFSNTLECTAIVVQWKRKWKIGFWAKWFSS